jgi:hypothetical protein
LRLCYSPHLEDNHGYWSTENFADSYR